MQRHVDTNADITVSCLPMDDRYVYMKYFHYFVSLIWYNLGKRPHLQELKLSPTIRGEVILNWNWS